MRKTVVLLPPLTLFLLFADAAAAQDGELSQPTPQGALTRGPTTVPIKVIYTNLASDASSDVPGLPGVKFQAGTGTGHFDRIYGSPGGRWALTALADLATTEDELLIVDNVVVAKEGDAASWTGGESIGLLDTQVGVNDSGDFAFATNTDGPTTGDEYLVGGASGGALFGAAQEGNAASPTLPGGATWGSTLESAVITADGTVGFVCDSVGGLPTTENEVVVLGTTLLAQEGVTAPAGQLGTETWENFDISDFWVTPDGMHSLLQGDLTGSTTTDDIVTVDGTVVVQEGVILAGSGFSDPVDSSGIVGVHLSADGSYFVRGNNDVSEVDWIYNNGALLTSIGVPIVTGATEAWSDVDFSDCFFLHVGNGVGDFILGGVTDASSDANGVLALNNDSVVVRESDPVDLDANGLFDDDLFFDTFGNDDAFLSDTGLFYFVATVKDGTGTRVGQGLFVATVSSTIFTDGFESGDTSAWSLAVP